LPTRALPTLEDVAREARVSTATVSRCLNSPERVVEKTRIRVLAAVQSLGYSPNFGARALASRRTNTIGAVIPTMENAIFARVIQALQETLSKSGSTLLVASSSYQPDIEEEQIRSLVARGADGLLLIGEERSDSIYEFLNKRGIPYVLAWAYRQGSDHCFVGFDNRSAAMEIARKVLDLGHTRIAMIAGLTHNNDRARDRVLGLKVAISERGLPVENVEIIETSYSFASGADALETLMKSTPRPTAVICGNDVLAIGAMKRAKSLGLRVPEDVSFTGFDDIELSSVVEPELTTMHVPHRKMGKIAAECLLAMLKTDTPSRSHHLKAFIVERQSLARHSQALGAKVDGG
jgi:LacI family transcriptional regulator, galactose operon repressor